MWYCHSVFIWNLVFNYQLIKPLCQHSNLKSWWKKITVCCVTCDLRCERTWQALACYGFFEKKRKKMEEIHFCVLRRTEFRGVGAHYTKSGFSLMKDKTLSSSEWPHKGSSICRRSLDICQWMAWKQMSESHLSMMLKRRCLAHREGSFHKCVQSLNIFWVPTACLLLWEYGNL